MTSDFSFSHSVFKRLVLQTRKNKGEFGKGLRDTLICFCVFQSYPGLTQDLNNHEDQDGFKLGTTVQGVCQAYRFAIKPGSVNVYSAALSKRLIYCPVAKIGSTFWRRLFYMLHKNTSYQNPYDVPILTAISASRLFSKRVGSRKITDVLFNNSFPFLIVRNPYSRLLSAYVDKLLGPNPIYWKKFGVKAIRAYRRSNNSKVIDGHDVTFEEFIRHVVDSERTGKNLDAHFKSIMKSCRPCRYKFNYIGKMEAFKEHAVFIMDKAGINTSVESIKNKLYELSVDDAILDSIQSPFSWKKDIIKFISWDKALRRIWLKLQMRGIITMDKNLNLSPENVNMSVSDFIELARNAHKESDPMDLKKTKDIAIHEAFGTVAVDVIKAFRRVFHFDFRLFGYNDLPPYSSNRSERTENILFNLSRMN